MKPCNCTEFILKHIIKITLGTGLVLSFFVLSDFWVNILNTWWVEPVMSKIDTDFKAWWVVGVLGGIVTWYYISAWRTEKLWNKTRFWIVIIPSALYLLCRCSQKWDFVPVCGWLCFTDAILLLLVVFEFLLSHRLIKKTTRATVIKILYKYDIIISRKIKVRLRWFCTLIKKTISAAIRRILRLCIIIMPGKIKVRLRWFRMVSYIDKPKYEGLAYCTPKDAPDNYGRGDYLASLSAEIAKSFPHDQSFATGITGEWGAGKSWFLESLERKIVKKDSSIVVIKFAPWSCNTPSEIISEFFELYKQEISVIVPSISSIIDRYVDALLDVADNGLTKSLKHLYHHRNKGMRHNYEHIKGCLERAQIKVLIVVDDLDRLHGPEIMEVLTLIRNTANFPYTHFLVAYDKAYITHTLAHVHIDRPEQYLEKIFNFEVALPRFEPKAICMELHKEIGSILKEHLTEDEIKEMIFINASLGVGYLNPYLIPKILRTRRDVIRFVNSFKVNLRACSDIITEICVKDFFYLELVRYGFPKIYKAIEGNWYNLLNIEEKFLIRKTELKIIHNELQEQYLQERDKKQRSSPSAVQGHPLSEMQVPPHKTRFELIEQRIKFLSQYVDSIDEIKSHIVCDLIDKLFPDKQGSLKNIASVNGHFSYFAYRAHSMNVSKAEMLAAITTNTIPERWNYEDEVYPNEVRDKLKEVIKDSTGDNQKEFRKDILLFLSTVLKGYSSDNKENTKFSRVQHEVFQTITYTSIGGVLGVKLPVYCMSLLLESLKHQTIIKNDSANSFKAIMDNASKQHDYFNMPKATEDDIYEIKHLLINAQCPANLSTLITELITNPSKTLIIPVEVLEKIQMNYL